MRTSLLAAAAVVLLAAPAAAQTGSIQATADVLTPLSVSGTQNLAFGDVFPGLSKSVGYAAATSGRFSVAGQANAQVSLSFDLPATLASGANTLPIGNWLATYSTDGTATAANEFVPSAAGQTASLSGTGQLFVFLGSTVTAASTQAAGSYAAAVDMTVVYTGL